MASERYYIGSTDNVEQRLEIHNGSRARWTKRYQPWRLVYSEEFATRGEAVKREKELKAIKGIRKFLESERRR